MARKRRRKQEPQFVVIGQMPDGRRIVTGAFEMTDTHGLPLDIVLSTLEDRKLAPCWITFYEKALAAGWNAKNTMAKLEAVVGDVYGPGFKESWLPMMKSYIQHRDAYRKRREEAGLPLQGK